ATSRCRCAQASNSGTAPGYGRAGGSCEQILVDRERVLEALAGDYAPCAQARCRRRRLRLYRQRQEHQALLLVQPAADVGVGGWHIQGEPRHLERGRQRRDEALFEIAVKALDLALGLGPVRPAHLGPKAVFVGQGGKRRVPAVLTLAIGIARGDDRPCVVKERLLGHPAEVGKGLPQAREPRFTVLALT